MQLTELGKRVLESNPPSIDNAFLEQFDSFRQFIRADSALPKALSSANADGQSPQDIFDRAFRQINHALADELLSEIAKQPPPFLSGSLSSCCAAWGTAVP